MAGDSSVFEMVSSETLQSILGLLQRIDPKTLPESHRDLKSKVLHAIFNLQKGKVEFMVNRDIQKLMRLASSLASTDKKFCRTLTSVVVKRVRHVYKGMLPGVLLLDSRLDAATVQELRADLLAIIAHMLENKVIGDLRMSELTEFVVAIKRYENKGLFSGSKVLKDHLLSEVLETAVKHIHSAATGANQGGSSARNAVQEIGGLMEAFNNLEMSDQVKEAYSNFLVNVPEAGHDTELTIRRCQHLLQMVADLSKKIEFSPVNDEESIKIKFKIGELKRALMGLRRKLSGAIRKSSAKEAVEIFRLMTQLNDSEDLSIPSFIQKITVGKLVQESYIFSTPELLSHLKLLQPHIPETEALIIKAVDELCLNEYSQTVQVEYQFRKLMNSKYNSVFDWPDEQDLTTGKFKSYRDIESLALEIKPLFKINTLSCNALLLLSQTSAKHLVKTHLSKVDRRYCTAESLAILDSLPT